MKWCRHPTREQKIAVGLTGDEQTELQRFGRRSNMAIKVPCKYCRQPFWKKWAYVQNSYNRSLNNYCCSAHATEATEGARFSVGIPRTCIVCNNEFFTRQGKRLYCSVVCACKAKRKKICARCSCDFLGAVMAGYCSSCLVIVHGLRQLRIREGDRVDIDTLIRVCGPECTYCGRKTTRTVPRGYPLRATIDHVIPLVQGGLDTWGNCVVACHQCNCEKQARTPEQWRTGKPIQMYMAAKAGI